MTYSPFQESLFADELTSSPDQPPVSHSAKPESDKVQTMSGISFQSFFEWWQKSDHAGSSLKTFSACLISSLDGYSRRITHHWKVKATPFKRYVFQLQPSMPRTVEIDCGLLPMIPTPTSGRADQGMSPSQYERHTLNLAQTVQMLLTPSTVNIEPTGDRREKRKAYRASVGRQDCAGGLAEQLQMLGTPTSTDYRSAGNNPNSKRFSQKTELRSQVTLLGTPKAQDSRAALADRGKHNMGEQVQGHLDGANSGLRLQPAFVEYLMGFPMNYTSLEAETTE